MAASLKAHQLWPPERPQQALDAQDWWYRLPLAALDAGFDAGRDCGTTVLGMEGLATLAQVWLNGTLLLTSDNMFVAHEVQVGHLLTGRDELVICLQSLDGPLAHRRPRPRWRVPMLAHQRLNWIRTSILGRTPGWSPPAPPIGPWRPLWVEERSGVSIGAPLLRTSVAGQKGTFHLQCEISSLEHTHIAAATVCLRRDGREYRSLLQRLPEHRFGGSLVIDDPDLWWPHTHGEPALYEVLLDIEGAGTSVRATFGHIGFRTISVDTGADNFIVWVNGVKVFCRGANWTPLDVLTLDASQEQLDSALDQVVAAGFNMLRVSGATVYESDAFLDGCDARGILLWQDFMFANMEYPVDAAFEKSVRLEAGQLLARLSGRPSLAVLCGNSEAEQQAAMWGAPRDRWQQPLFYRVLPEVCAELAPGTCYWPSSAHGGALPHQTDAGTVSYYGVGAYLRPLSDARRSDVRFATECLALANVSETSAAGDESTPRVHTPAYKARTPRDLGAGWDFDDVRDFYLRELFGVDPLALRYGQHERYLLLSRIVSGEVMAGAFREWRRAGSACNGALIWFLKDLWAGSGWGIIDAQGKPKAPYYFLKRLLQPQAMCLTDEGGSGIRAHIVNERSSALHGLLQLRLFRHGQISVGAAERQLTVPPHTSLAVDCAALFDGFIDLNYAYRFGAPVCDLIYASLTAENGTSLVREFFFPLGLDAPQINLGMSAQVRRLDARTWRLQLQSASAARYVTVQSEHHVASDQYFHLAPGIAHEISLTACTADGELRAEVRALNGLETCRILGE